MQDEMVQKTGETLGSLGVSGLKLRCFLARAAEMRETNPQKTGKN